MFNQDAIKALANHLNSREYAPQINALSTLSLLILRKHFASNVVTSTEIGHLLHSKLEDAFPLPYLNLVVDGIKGTVTLNHYEFKMPEELERPRILWNDPASPWSVVVKDENGQYLMIASGDRYAIPHGEIGVPFDYDRHMSLTGTFRTGNLMLNGSHAIWFIETWADYGKIISHSGYDIPLSTVHRIFNQYAPQPDQSPLELITKEDMHSTFLNQDTTDELGLPNRPMPYTVLEVVEGLVESQRLKCISDESTAASVHISGKLAAALGYPGGEGDDSETVLDVVKYAAKLYTAVAHLDLDTADIKKQNRVLEALDFVEMIRHLKMSGKTGKKAILEYVRDAVEVQLGRYK